METFAEFVIFPYLQTSQSVQIRGVEYRSSDNLRLLPEQVQAQLRQLFSVFYARDDIRIARMVYTSLIPESRGDIEFFRDATRKTQTLVNYLYGASDLNYGRPVLTAEHCRAYTFHRDNISPEVLQLGLGQDNIIDEADHLAERTQDRIAGYDGLLNWEHPLFIAPWSRIYPPRPFFPLLTVDLSSNISAFCQERRMWAFNYLFENEDAQLSTSLESRMFTALEWYNRSTASDISEQSALVDLAIAFESLLELPNDNVTTRFKEVVLILLGRVPNLENWLEQFYKARSSVVHEGHTSQMMFQALDKQQWTAYLKGTQPGAPFRPLIAYGRQIFRMCVIAILSGTTLAEIAGLPAIFTSNKDRLSRIIRHLDDADSPPLIRLSAIAPDARDLSTYSSDADRQVNGKLLWGIAHRTLEAFLNCNLHTAESLSQQLTTILQEFSNSDEKQRIASFTEILNNVKTQITAIRNGSQEDPEAAILLLMIVEDVLSYVITHARRY